MLSKNHPIIIFIDRNGFSVFQDVLPSIAKFNFTQDIVVNLDIVNKTKFINLITTFIQINKIIPSSLMIILSDNVIYFKDIASLPQASSKQSASGPSSLRNGNKSLGVSENIDKEHEEEIQKFLENVPFEDLLAKVIKANHLSRIVAVNKDLIMTIVDTFTSKGSVLEAIIPSFMYGPSVSFAQGLTHGNIQAILGGSEIFRTGNMLMDQQKVSSTQSLGEELKSPPKEREKKPQNIRQFILIGIFFTLLIIFAVVYLNMGTSPTPEKKEENSVVNPTSVPTLVPSLTKAPIATSSSNIEDINVTITQGSSSTISGVLRTQLSEMGFENIESRVSEDSISQKATILFSNDISTNLRNEVLSEIRSILPNISILEDQNSSSEIAILVGNS